LEKNLGKIDMASVQNGLELFESEGRNWTPPAPTSKPTTGLHVYNSLSREKVPFVTRDGSKQVTWYICGPTVYDSSHLGHARNYVTFDIIRRIMKEYFGYYILYVMNVTDVDDKIINRARRNYLLDHFRATATNPGEVFLEFSIC
jgi:cysteinyl-tRNA synthetase